MPATGLADSFDPNANKSAVVNSIAVQADGKILSGGNLPRLPNGGATWRATASPGSMPRRNWHDSFDPNANDIVNAIAVQADGKILAGGSVHEHRRTRRAIASPGSMLLPAWRIRSTRTRTVLSVPSRVQADGKILAGGAFNGTNSIGGQARNHIARLDATTGLADSFDPNADGEVRSIAVPADGKILAGGQFRTASAGRRAIFSLV